MAAIFGAVNFTSVHQAEAEEQQRDFEFEIQELLLTAGYFRARIANLSPFEKACTITMPHYFCATALSNRAQKPAFQPALKASFPQVIGGLAWSVTASNVEVDIHLIYDEDANIGTKIKLSEAIEFALKRMKCPYPLQAHQIQGLDYPAVFPVVQWLVKKARRGTAPDSLSFPSGRFATLTRPASRPRSPAPTGARDPRRVRRPYPVLLPLYVLHCPGVQSPGPNRGPSCFVPTPFQLLSRCRFPDLPMTVALPECLYNKRPAQAAKVLPRPSLSPTGAIHSCCRQAECRVRRERIQAAAAPAEGARGRSTGGAVQAGPLRPLGVRVRTLSAQLSHFLLP